MEIKVLQLGDIGVNCYLLSTKTAAVIIDPGFVSPKIDEFINEQKGKEILCLLTHGHFDHIGAVTHLKEKYGIKVAIGELDAPATLDDELNLSDWFGIPTPHFSADITLSDNEEFSVGDITFKAIHTPGHTVGGMCYLTQNILFSGDTLFYGSIGRTDFPGGNFDTLASSIKKLYLLDGSTALLSGHGQPSDIATEKQYNPFVREC